MSDAITYEDTPNHYWMVTLEFILEVNIGDRRGTVPVKTNAVYTNRNGFVTQPGLAEIQQNAADQLIEQNPDSQVLNLVILAISPMGWMTEEQFHKGHIAVPDMPVEPLDIV